MLNPGVVNPKVSLLRSHSCDSSDALWAPWHQVCTHLFVASFTAFFLCSTKFAYYRWRLNTSETWQQGYELVRFVASYNFLHCRGGLSEVRTKSIWYPLAANFALRWALAGRWLNHIKHLLCAIAALNFWLLPRTIWYVAFEWTPSHSNFFIGNPYVHVYVPT